MMERQRRFRFAIPDRESLGRLTAEPLPGGDGDDVAELDFARDIYFDTPTLDLAHKGASVRLRFQRDGTTTLRLDVLESGPAGGEVRRQSSEAVVANAEPAAVLAGPSEPARLLRALTDPGRLETVLELERLRRTRRARPRDGKEIDVAIDVVTVRSGALVGELLELELAVDEEGGAGAADFADALRARFGLQPVLAETVTRARRLLEQLETTGLEQQLRGAREVAVVVHDAGRLAFVRRRGRLCVPAAAGSGSRSCRRALRRAFGHSRARIRLLGTRADVPGRPALEVWLAENAAAPESPDDVTWVPIRKALDRAGSPGLRDARTLGALHVVARSAFASWALPAWSRGDAPEHNGAEPFEAVLQGLESNDTAWEPPARRVPPRLLLNMELSRLAFDERVLAFAADPAVPLLERIRFLGMSGERGDDFFMSRVARFKRLLARDSGERSLDGLTPAEQLDAIAIRAREITRRAYQLLNDELLPQLQTHGVTIERWASLSAPDRIFVRDTWGSRLEALVTPIVADPAHPFPHVRNLRPALAAIVRVPHVGTEQFVAIEMPGDVPRFVPLADGRRFVPLEDVVQGMLPELYPGLEVVAAHTFRVTRSAAMDLAGEPLDILQSIEEGVTRRPFQEVVRLQVEHEMPRHMRHHLLREFQYEHETPLSTPGEQDVFTVGRMVDLAALSEIAAIDMPELKYPALEQRTPFDADRSVMEQIGEQDRLVCFPFDSFEESVERFVREAAADPAVVSIKTTLYRTGRQSGIVEALREARSRGKDVAAMVELKASFDEQRNIEWARGLEQDGIRVVFSPALVKVHAKILLVVRREGAALRRYGFVGTGNLNAATARSYVDIGLFTTDDAITREIGAVFNLLTGYSGTAEFNHLIVAPFAMRRRLLRLIEREIEHARAGRPSGMRIQLNGLADRRLIGALYRASQAGVRIEMMIREICSLRPGVPGVSDNISVVSIVGRLLQHARILHFRNGGADEYYIGSADWRPRNLLERIEVVAPVRHPEHQAVLDRMLHNVLDDPARWELRPGGEYVSGDQRVGRIRPRSRR
jgi:polyphosphate kinase